MLEIYKFNEGFCRRNLRLIAIKKIDDFFEIIDSSASCACAQINELVRQEVK